MQFSSSTSALKSGFTLIELSIVLVIIGLIIGGVVVGQDLISTAAVRAQISQIEKYNAAVNTFRGKYGYLPGDIPDPAANQYGFAARGSVAGEGDGNGIIQGKNGFGFDLVRGETIMVWVDLSAAGLIDGDFTLGSETASPPLALGGAVGSYFPTGRIGNNNYVYVWSGGWPVFNSDSDGYNYFALANVMGISQIGVEATTGLTVNQAYSIDSKIDDGLPQTGNVIALYTNGFTATPAFWAAGGLYYNSFTNGGADFSTPSGDYDSTTNGPVTNPADIGDGGGPANYTCYDGSGGLPERYSMQNADLVNCALSFKFQ